MALDDPLILLVTAVGILVGLSVITLLYLERTKDKRIREARQSKGLDSDNEAYNAVQSAKSISSVMKRKGRDTDEADMVLERAEMALDSNNYSKAKSLAEEAKGKLQSITPSTTTMSASETDKVEDTDEGKTGTTKKKAYTEDDLDVLETKASDSEEESEMRKEFKERKEKIRNLPENYLESRFEIRQAKAKLEDSEGVANTEAKEKLKSAREAFDSENYTKALSLSIECKKKIGTEENEIIKGQDIGEQKEPDIPEGFEELETIGGSEQAQSQGVTKTRGTKESRERQEEPEQVEEEIEDGEEEDMEDKLSELEELGESEVVEEEVSVERESDIEEGLGVEKEEGEVQETLICPDCGNEGREGDQFCHKCGTELAVRLNCPGCGAEVQEEDRFCPKCGIELTPITYACPDCGAEIEREAQFCPQCGVEFE